MQFFYFYDCQCYMQTGLDYGESGMHQNLKKEHKTVSLFSFPFINLIRRRNG